MASGSPGADVELAARVAAEVERQLRPLREELDAKLTALRERTADDAATIVVFSNDLDRVLAAFVMATGAAAAGLETSMFFTFWGLGVLRRTGAPPGPKTLAERIFALSTPSGTRRLGTSKMNFLGAGAALLRRMMKEKQIASLEELVDVSRDLGVKMIACTMSMDAMGISRDELVDGLSYGGVATYMADATRSRVTLFI
jgi:peroxiredoxin family protein